MSNQLDYLNQLNDQFSQLMQQMDGRLATQQYGAVLGYVAAFSYNTVTSTLKISQLLGLDPTLAEEILNRLTAIGVLQRDRGIRCPECNLLFHSIENGTDIEYEMYCYGCEDYVDIDESDIEVIYTLRRECCEG